MTVISGHKFISAFIERASLTLPADVERLVALLDTEDEYDRFRIVQRLRELDDESLENRHIVRLRECLTDEDWLVRVESIELMGDWLRYEARPHIRKRLRDECAIVRAYAAEVLAELDDRDMVPVFQGMLEDAEDRERVSLYHSLITLGQTDYLQEYLALLRSDDKNARSATAYGIESLQTEDNAPAIRAALLRAIAVERNADAMTALRRARDDLDAEFPAREGNSGCGVIELGEARCEPAG